VTVTCEIIQHSCKVSPRVTDISEDIGNFHHMG